MRIGFIGLGNMAKAIIGGILEKNIIAAKDILGSAKTEETKKKVAEEFETTPEFVEFANRIKIETE